jgi:Uri superfamily endonuclease
LNNIYILVIKLKRDIPLLTKRSSFKLEEGVYIYIGSAKKNLNSRIKRHLSKFKKYHWHIDYLLEFAKIKKIYIANTDKNECQIARKIEEIFQGKPILNFGSSDCKCQSHLINIYDYSDSKKRFQRLKRFQNISIIRVQNLYNRIYNNLQKLGFKEIGGVNEYICID